MSTRLNAGDALQRFVDAGGPIVSAITNAMNAVGGAIGSVAAGILSFFASLWG